MILYTNLIKPIKKLKTIHTGGGYTNQKLMPIPDFLIIKEEDKKESGFMLYRYTKEEEFAGDTWHPNLQEAKDQAKFEYGDSIDKWREIPEGIVDPLKYVMNLFNNN